MTAHPMPPREERASLLHKIAERVGFDEQWVEERLDEQEAEGPEVWADKQAAVTAWIDQFEAEEDDMAEAGEARCIYCGERKGLGEFEDGLRCKLCVEEQDG